MLAVTASRLDGLHDVSDVVGPASVLFSFTTAWCSWLTMTTDGSGGVPILGLACRHFGRESHCSRLICSCSGWDLRFSVLLDFRLRFADRGLSPGSASGTSSAVSLRIQLCSGNSRYCRCCPHHHLDIWVGTMPVAC